MQESGPTFCKSSRGIVKYQRNQQQAAAVIDRRATGRWEYLSHLTGLAVGEKHTGWDRLAQIILDEPAVRLASIRRLEAIVNLCRMLTRLSESQFIVLTLRLGLSVDDQVVEARSRQDVSQTLQLSVSRIAQLEREAINDLRARFSFEFPDLPAYVYRRPLPDEPN